MSRTFFIRLAIVVAIVLLLSLLVEYCNKCLYEPDTPPELVMLDGSRIEVNSRDQHLAIYAGPKYDRRYKWNGCTLTAHPCPRRDRWNGSLGIYDPATGGIDRLFIACDGISRPVVEEGQRHFQTLDEAEAWIDYYQMIGSQTTVWSNDGLLIKWGIVSRRSQLNAYVWQICIAGRKPTSLKGATDGAITVTARDDQSSGRHDCVDAHQSAMAEIKDLRRIN